MPLHAPALVLRGCGLLTCGKMSAKPAARAAAASAAVNSEAFPSLRPTVAIAVAAVPSSPTLRTLNTHPAGYPPPPIVLYPPNDTRSSKMVSPQTDPIYAPPIWLDSTIFHWSIINMPMPLISFIAGKLLMKPTKCD